MEMPPIPPQMQQQLLAALQRAQAGAGGQGSQQMSVPGGGAPPQQSPQMPSSQQSQQMPQLGGNNIMLPGGTASPGVPGVQMSATPPKQTGSIAARGVAALPGAVFAVKQSMQRSKTEKARQLAGQYLAMQNADDPKVKQAANQLLADPKNHKIFEKAVTDPGSPEYAGVQMAYRDLVTQEQQSAAMQEMRGKVQEQMAAAQQKQALAQQESANAARMQKQTEQMGTVTDKDKETNRIKEEQIKARGEQVTAQIQARLQQTQQQTKAMLDATKMRTRATVQSATIRGKATVNAASQRAAKADTYIQGEYKILNQQLTELDRHSKDLAAQITKDTHWYGDDDGKADVQSQLSQIEAQRGVLAAQFQMLQQKDRAFQTSGVTPPPQQQTKGKGTQDDPIVIP